MTEMTFRVRWPDGHEEEILAPSAAVRDYFRAGDRFLLAEFVARVRGALSTASERVAGPFGSVCGRTTEQLARIERTAARFCDDYDAWVSIIALSTTPVSKPIEVRIVASV